MTEPKAPLYANTETKIPDGYDLHILFNGVVTTADWFEIDVMGMWGRRYVPNESSKISRDDDGCPILEKVYGRFELRYAPSFPGKETSRDLRENLPFKEVDGKTMVYSRGGIGAKREPAKFVLGQPTEFACMLCDNKNVVCKHMDGHMWEDINVDQWLPHALSTFTKPPLADLAELNIAHYSGAKMDFAEIEKRALGYYMTTNPHPDGWAQQMFDKPTPTDIYADAAKYMTATEEARRQERKFYDDTRGFIRHTMYALLAHDQANFIASEISDGAIHQCMTRGLDPREAAGQVLLGLITLGTNADWQSRRVQLKNDPSRFAEVYGTGGKNFVHQMGKIKELAMGYHGARTGRWSSEHAHVIVRKDGTIEHVPFKARGWSDEFRTPEAQAALRDGGQGQQESRMHRGVNQKVEVHVHGNALEQLRKLAAGMNDAAMKYRK